MSEAPVTDCGGDDCDECDVCRRMAFREWVGSVGKPAGSTIEANERVDRYIKEKYGV